MIYFTSDLHFCHTNILKYQESTRPYTTTEEMNEDIIKKWNSAAKHSDEIYLLGDVSMGHKAEARDLTSRLKGRIHLIRGNHDHWSRVQEEELFASANDYKVLKYQGERLVLFHYPIEEWDRCYYGDMHLHGHTHGNLERKLPNRFDMGWDIHHRLVPIDEVLSWRTPEHVPHHGKTKPRTEEMPI